MQTPRDMREKKRPGWKGEKLSAKGFGREAVVGG